jgi:hypothetical protein
MTERRSTTRRAAAAARGRGGFRGTTAKARFTAQLVALCEPDRRDRVLDLAETHGVSQAKIMRAVIDAGLGAVEAGLADGSLSVAAMA